MTGEAGSRCLLLALAVSKDRRVSAEWDLHVWSHMSVAWLGSTATSDCFCCDGARRVGDVWRVGEEAP